MIRIIKSVTILITIFGLETISFSQSVKDKIDSEALIQTLTGKYWRTTLKPIALVSAIAIGDNVQITFSKQASEVMLSSDVLQQMTDSVRLWIGKPNVNVSFMVEGKNLKSILPHLWPQSDGCVFVKREGADVTDAALSGRTFAVWNSHGRYYERSLDRWEWQRARLFTTVEDILSSSFVLPMLVPMLENAGAYVVMPRERDIQSAMSVADDTEMTIYGASDIRKVKGYGKCNIVTGFDNPFVSGTATICNMQDNDSIVFSSGVDTMGYYAVYVCYVAHPSNSQSARFTVYHDGGPTTYVVDERKGGSMWVYLGRHHFSGKWSVVLKGCGQLSADAVRLGGGMGSVARNGKTSGMPSWMEGARYYMQTDGFDAAKVYALSGGVNDYTDDINGRGEWVNALMNNKSLHIDASIAFHTDAGIAAGDSVYGTLTIVNTGNGKGKYSDGRSRNMARDLAQMIEQNICSDLRATWCKEWAQRGIWDKGYSEARRQDVPSVLIELLSHQNLTDIRYALHPQFRFDVCRAIYKGLLRFFCGKSAVVQPLPVKCFGMQQVASDSLQLVWQPTVDGLESTAIPTRYLVYANDKFIASTSDTFAIVHQVDDGSLVRYRVVAENVGGRSFPSQVLSASLKKGLPRALFVDGYDRLSSPDVVSTAQFGGLLSHLEQNVGWGNDVFKCGNQYDFNPQSQWLDDDAPGWGASFANFEGESFIGSHTDDVPDVVQQMVGRYSFVSQSKDFFENSSYQSFDFIHIWLSNQRTSWYGDMQSRHAIYTNAFLDKLEQIALWSTPTLLTGAYIGTDIPNNDVAKRVEKILGFKFRTNQASQSRIVVDKLGRQIILPQKPSQSGFAIAPDAIEPIAGALTIERYADTQMSAAIKYGCFVVKGY